MKIALGIDRSDDRESLSGLMAAGATEFFAGYVPVEWYNRYGWEVSPNRRENGPDYQFTRFADLRHAVTAAHELGATVTITFNAHNHCLERLVMLRDMVRQVEELEPDAYVVADPALMLEMRDWGVTRSLHLSTGAACFSAAAIRFLHEEVGVARAVLPRKLTIREMSRLTDRLRDLGLEFEAMVMGPRCFFNDELCFTLHSGNMPSFCYAMETSVSARRRMPPDWKERVARIAAAPEAQIASDSELNKLVRELVLAPPASPEHQARCGDGISMDLAERFFLNCGLCAIAPLRAAGVTVLKLPARGNPHAKRLYTQLVRKVAAMEAPTREECRELLGSPDFCRTAQHCYYALDE